MIDRADVAVVGAGFSGLAAARAIVQAGASVIVLEARDRVGGRAYSRTIGGEVVEMGAEWTGPGQDAIQRFAAEMGVTMATRALGGRDLYVEEDRAAVGGFRVLDEPPVDPEALAAAVSELDGLAASVSAEAPWQAPSADLWDRLTVSAWVEEHVAPSARRALYGVMEGWVGNPANVSFLHALFYASANRGYASFFGLDGPLHDFQVFVEGAQTIAKRIAVELGERVKLGRAVELVRQDENGVALGGSGFEVRAERAIIALPPTVASRITYDPPLPNERTHLAMRHAPLGGWKFMVVYDEPFWRGAGLSGTVVSDRLVTVDAGTEEGRRGILAGFPSDTSGLCGHGAEARKRTLDWLVCGLGPKAASPIAFTDVDWLTDPYSLGCVTYATPGTWTAFGKCLRAPIGRIHWAGTETATVMASHMDGAVRAGERAAAEVLGELR